MVKAAGTSLILDLFRISLANAKYAFELVILAGNVRSSHQVFPTSCYFTPKCIENVDGILVIGKLHRNYGFLLPPE